jgi:hypothetical protein
MRGYAAAMSNEDDISHEETTDPLVADARNFYKVEKWTRDGTKVDSPLYAGNSPRGVRECDQAADAGAGAVATARDSTLIRRLNTIRLSSVALA